MPASVNRFDALRLLFAGAVFAYHLLGLSGQWAGQGLENSLAQLAEISIQGFFIISGALVYGSLERSRSVADYAGKRIRRLYPAYAVIILVPALISLVLTGQVAGVAKYLAGNLAFLNFLAPELPGFFQHNRFTAVNGALWTLKVEVAFYLVLPLLAWALRRAGRWKWAMLASLYIAGEVWRAVFLSSGEPGAASLARQLPGQMSFFVAGMAMWLVWDRAEQAGWRAAIVGAVILAASIWIEALIPLRAIGLALLIATAAFASGPALNAARFGDISYGVYIIHFPIIQALVAAGLFAFNPALGIAVSVAIVIALSYALWHLVEKPALRPSSHYRRAAEAE